jgi:hypothetical protein
MCLHSQAKSNPEITLLDGLKHDFSQAIANVDISLISPDSLETESTRMKKASWTTLRSLIKPKP